MLLETKHFGRMEIDESELISFDEGILGFPDLKKYALLNEQDSNDDVFRWLQSAEDESVAFIVIDMLQYDPEYNPLVDIEQMDSLGDYNPDYFRIYNIANLKENVMDMTVNLKAPVVINMSLKKGKQVICNNEEYTIRHYLFR